MKGCESTPQRAPHICPYRCVFEDGQRRDVWAAGGDLSQLIDSRWQEGVRTPLAGHSSGRTDVCDSSLNVRTGRNVVFTIMSTTTCLETAPALECMPPADRRRPRGYGAALVPGNDGGGGLLPPPGHRQPRHQGERLVLTAMQPNGSAIAQAASVIMCAVAGRFVGHSVS